MSRAFPATVIAAAEEVQRTAGADNPARVLADWVLKHPRPLSLTHGTHQAYSNGGCRCAPCTVAASVESAKQRADRAERVRADPSIVEHGLVKTYGYWGCRCAECKAAQSDARERKKAALAAGDVEVEHGTTNAYQAYGCRCAPCRAARSEGRQNDRDRRAETRNAPRLEES